VLFPKPEPSLWHKKANIDALKLVRVHKPTDRLKTQLLSWGGSIFTPIFMKSVNTVTLLGHVTRDPETKVSPSGQTICRFGLATNRTWRTPEGEKKESVEFHNLVVWGKFGDFAEKYVKKGKPVYVEGHLKTGSWENPQGVKLHRTEVIVDNLVLLGAKDKSPETESAAIEEELVAA
jgi:single-strand DNA-binding protein